MSYNQEKDKPTYRAINHEFEFLDNEKIITSNEDSLIIWNKQDGT
jgi:hypothetical protein